VRISGLSDVSFGTIGNLGVNQVRTQTVCAHAQVGTYSVTASGSGPGNSFRLSSGTRLLPYEVQWAGSAGQTSGTALTANLPSVGFPSDGNHQCNRGPTASLIIILRATNLQSATAGDYGGTLTLLLAPM
jgi:hypothetical protein